MSPGRWIAERNAGWKTMSQRARNLLLVSLVAAAVSATLLCLGYWLNQTYGLRAALGPFGVAVFFAVVATASHARAMVDWRRNRRPGHPRRSR